MSGTKGPAQYRSKVSTMRKMKTPASTFCHPELSASTSRSYRANHQHDSDGAGAAAHHRYRDFPQLFAGCCQFDLNSLLHNPFQLGAFLAVCRLIREIEPEAEHAAINLALRGTAIPGFELVRRQNPGY